MPRIKKALLELADDADNAARLMRFAKRYSKGDVETVPIAVVDRLLAGESRLRVWREHRGMTAAKLAKVLAAQLDDLGVGLRAPSARRPDPASLLQDDARMPLVPRVPPFERPASYDDLVKLPDHVVAEIVGGELHASPRPAPRHAVAYVRAMTLLALAFDFGPIRTWRLVDPRRA